RTEYFQANLRLSHTRAETGPAVSLSVIDNKVWKIQVVYRPSAAERVQEHDSGKAHTVSGGAFNLGLILLIDLRGQEFLVFGEFFQKILILGGGGRRSLNRPFEGACPRERRGKLLAGFVEFEPERRDFRTRAQHVRFHLFYHRR